MFCFIKSVYAVLLQSTYETSVKNRAFSYKSMEFGVFGLTHIRINFSIGAHPSDSPGPTVVGKKGQNLCLAYN